MDELGRDLVLWFALYVAALLGIGFLARRAQRAETLSDHFLAGRTIGFLVLLLTLFATQYSGNSVSGFPGQTYRDGLVYFMSVAFMVGIVSGYILFAPSLRHASRELNLLTPTDFLAHRFGSPVLNYVSAAVFALTLCNFMLAQLMALGHAFGGLTGGQIPYAAGVAGGAVVILLYEILGGMRAVAWTDVIQGAILAVGLTLVLVLLAGEVGSPAAVLAQIRAVAPEKVAAPSAETCRLWCSHFVLLALGAPLYPQAIQRIYAARRTRELRRALAVMAVLPLVAITPVVFLGAAGIALFPGLDAVESERISFRVLAYLLEQEPLAYYPTLMVMLAVVAAIMSTADSCLLSLASIVTKDFFARLRGLHAYEAERLTGVARACSAVIMALLVLVALEPRFTLWGLLVFKFELLVQLSPAFVLGTLHDRDDPRAFTRRDVVAGLAVGVGVFAVLHLSGHGVLLGLHAGTLGVAANYATAAALRAWRLRWA